MKNEGVGLPEGLALTARHCGQDMHYAGGGFRYQGIVAHTNYRLRCENCGLKVTVLAEDLDPLPASA